MALNRAGRLVWPPIVSFKIFILTESGFVPLLCVRQINISLSVSDSCEVSDAMHHSFQSTVLSGRVLAMIGQSFIVSISDYVVLWRYFIMAVLLVEEQEFGNEARPAFDSSCCRTSDCRRSSATKPDFFMSAALLGFGRQCG